MSCNPLVSKVCEDRCVRFERMYYDVSRIALKICGNSFGGVEMMPIFALPIEKTGLVLKVLRVAENVYR